jgi:HEAT repeat protein/beta-lactamase regulating signal transducer with metallopeptidase domain
MMPADHGVISAAVMSWLLTYSIHSTILLTAAAVIAWRFSDQHAWLDAIWKAALIGPLVTASLNVDAIAMGGRWVMPGVSTVSGEAARARYQSTETAASAETGDEDATFTPSSERAVILAQPIPLDNGRSSAWPSVLRAWPSIAVTAWALIAGVGLAQYGMKLIHFYRAVGAGRSVKAPTLLHSLDELTASIRDRRIRLTTSGVCAVPLALAGRHIVLPERFLEELDADQQRAALAHEMAHVIRRDPAWRIVAAIVERAFFFQPLNRVARRRITESAEFLCDRWAVEQTGAPVALARCLSMVASWASPANDESAVGVNAMARSDSAMVRRVTQILSEPAPVTRRSRAPWLVIPLAMVTVAAPRVTAMRLPASVPLRPPAATVAVKSPARAGSTGQARSASREWTGAVIARAQSNVRVHRPDRPSDSLDNRWRWALAEARRQRLAGFWIAYSFETPVHGQGVVMRDSNGNSFVSVEGRLQTSGPPLSDVLRDGGGNIVVLLHYRGTDDDAIDRAAYRSATIGFDFERAPLFWLGFADDTQSFNQVRGLFERARAKDIQHFLIDLASIHGNSNLVIPFLTRLVEASQPTAIRHEAAEGFGHQHDPRSVEILMRVARTDSVSEVRAEAAETIGEVQAPQAIAALTDLVNDSDDVEVRREAAEAFGEQPPEQALPALERVIATSGDEAVLNEAVEALGEIDDARALDALMRVIWEHKDEQLQREAVETIGDRDEDAGRIAALERILRDHPSEAVQSEAIDTLSDVSAPALHPQILALAGSGKSPRIRRDAIDAIADAVAESSDAEVLDGAEQTLERAIFDDPDSGVRMEALDALEKLPRDRERNVLRRVIDRHPDSRVRREAEDHLRDRRQ